MASSGIIMIVFIVFASLITALALVVWMIVSLVQGGKHKQTVSEEESKLMQELHHGLNKMDERVESLETLLLEKERDRRHAAERS